jgi:hypothetical protein
MRLERVVKLRRGAVRRVDDEIRLLEPALGVAALVRRRFGDVAIRFEAWRDVADRFLQIDDMRQELVIDLDEAERLDRGLLVVRRDRGHLVADVADLFAEDRLLAAERGLRRIEPVEDAANARQRFGLLRVDPPHPGTRIRAAEHADVEHAREIDVLRVSGPAGDPLDAVDTAARPRDLGELGPRGRDREILALHEDERFVDLAFELLPAPDDARHQDFRLPADTPALTMFGYAPQRQRFPATARRTSSSVGAVFSRSRPTIDMIWPGVQKPHWKASASMNAR